jgi:hypothetical protein
MRVSNLKLLCTSDTIENIEKLINKYFYSTSYKLIPYKTTKGISYDIVGIKGRLDNFVVKQEKKRYKFYEIEFSHNIKFPKQLN